MDCIGIPTCSRSCTQAYLTRVTCHASHATLEYFRRFCYLDPLDTARSAPAATRGFRNFDLLYGTVKVKSKTHRSPRHRQIAAITVNTQCLHPPRGLVSYRSYSSLLSSLLYYGSWVDRRRAAEINPGVVFVVPSEVIQLQRCRLVWHLLDEYGRAPHIAILGRLLSAPDLGQRWGGERGEAKVLLTGAWLMEVPQRPGVAFETHARCSIGCRISGWRFARAWERSDEIEAPMWIIGPSFPIGSDVEMTRVTATILANSVRSVR
jgi:hypothetical protein